VITITKLYFFSQTHYIFYTFNNLDSKKGWEGEVNYIKDVFNK